MRALLFAAALACLTSGASGCVPRSQPYRFSMPMLGHADVPPPALPAPLRKPMSPPRRSPDAIAAASAKPPRPRYAYGWQTDAQAGIRVASAKGIELSLPEASEQSAAAVTTGVVISRLRAPHQPAPAGITAPVALPGLDHIREPADLRSWIGRRDKRAPLAVVLAWLADLGLASDELLALASGGELVAWAEPRGSLFPPTAEPRPGDLLLFSRALSDEPADLVALVIGRDTRGVTEIVYAAGGVIRRGFVDVAHPASRRDLRGGVSNTFLRHGRRQPPKGTRYLAGELLAHLIRVH